MVNDAAQAEVAGHFIINEGERKELLDGMFSLLNHIVCNNNLYESLKFSNNSVAKYHWFLGGEIERPLVDLLLESNIAAVLADAVLPIRAGNLFDEIVGNYIKRKYKFDLISEGISDPVYEKNMINDENKNLLNNYTVAVTIPDFYLPGLINEVPLTEYFKIRKDLLPLRKNYLAEVYKLKKEINSLSAQDKEAEAYEALLSFHERVFASFQVYSNLLKKCAKSLKV